MIELLDKRTRASKTYYLGDAKGGRKRYACDACVGAMHYNTDEVGLSGEWLDIDTRPVNGRVTSAPYEADALTDGRCGVVYRSKHSGEFEMCLESALGVKPRLCDPYQEGTRLIWPDIFEDADGVVIFGRTRVTVALRLKSPNAPGGHLVRQVGIEGRARILPIRPATAADGTMLEMLSEPDKLGRREFFRLGRETVDLSRYCMVDIEGVERDPRALAYPIMDATTIDEQVGASADDGYGTSGGIFRTDLDYIYLGESAGFTLTGLFRFPGLAIAMGVTIDTTTIQEYQYDIEVGAGCETIIYADDQAGPAAPTTLADLNGRTRTTAGVGWSDPVGSVGWNTSPELKSIIQELADDYNITAIQGIQDRNGGTKWNRAASYDYDDNTKGAKLHIEYSVAGGTTYDEKGKEQVILVVQSEADSAIFSDDVGQVILAVDGEAEAAVRTETGLGQVILAVQGESDAATFRDTGLAQVALVVTGEDDAAIFDDTGAIQVVLVITGEADSATFQDTGLLQVILAVDGESEILVLPETGLTQIILAAQGEADAAIFTGTSGQVILAVTGETDVSTRVELGALQVVLVVTGEGDSVILYTVHAFQTFTHALRSSPGMLRSGAHSLRSERLR